MQKYSSSFEINPYWIYLSGIFLILLQTLNIIPIWTTPTGWGKTIFFRIIFSILLFVFASQLIFKKVDLISLKERLKPVKWGIFLLLAFLMINFLSTVFSPDIQVSLWGDPNRAGGFVNLAMYILFGIFCFLIIKKRDWPKVLDFAIFIGVIVSAIAMLQQFGIFGKYLIPFTFRPISTIGNAIILSLYLVLVSFLPISLGITTKKKWKKIFYFSASTLSILVIILFVQTRGAYIGLFFGALWFLFFYPKKINKTKLIVFAVIALTLLSGFSLKLFLDRHLDYYKKLPPIISSALDRGLSVFEGTGIISSRLSAWKVSLIAFKEKPLLGYGLENFYIAFDKHYDPSLPVLGPDKDGNFTEWWDRAHNFFFDISITSGLFASLIYIALFIFLILNLIKTSKNGDENSILRIGLSATFVAYLCALFFTFDIFDTYLIFYLFSGFSLFSISNYKMPEKQTTDLQNITPNAIFEKIYKLRIAIVTILFILLVYFISIDNLKPLNVNRILNTAEFYTSVNKCDLAIREIENIPNTYTIIDSFVKQKYASLTFDCQKKSSTPPLLLAERAFQTLKKNAELHPARLQNWIALSEYTEILIEEKIKLNDGVYVANLEMTDLKNQAMKYFEKAVSLSPKRQIIFKDWAKLGINTEDYTLTENKASACIDLNSNYTYCWWLKALAKGYMGDKSGFLQISGEAEKRGFNLDSPDAIQMVADMYIKNKDYENLIIAYKKLIDIAEEKTKEEKIKKAQLYASLATTYQIIGKITDARTTALEILKIDSSFKALVDEFLKTL